MSCSIERRLSKGLDLYSEITLDGADPSIQIEFTRVETLVTGRLHPDPADARSPLLRAFRTSGTDSARISLERSTT